MRQLSIYPILSYPILSYPILSYPIPSHPIPSHPILSHPILSYPNLSIYLGPMPVGGAEVPNRLATVIKTEYWDRAGGGGNISYDW